MELREDRVQRLVPSCNWAIELLVAFPTDVLAARWRIGFFSCSVWLGLRTEIEADTRSSQMPKPKPKTEKTKISGRFDFRFPVKKCPA